MIYNKFIVCQTQAAFDSNLASGEITNQHIVFIQETKKIWHDGVLYGSDDYGDLTESELENLANLIITDGDGNGFLANDGTYKEVDARSYYFIPYELLSLANESLSQEVLDALGGNPDNFTDICNAINDGELLALKSEDNVICSLNSFTETNAFTFIVCSVEDDGTIIIKSYRISFEDGSYKCEVTESDISNIGANERVRVNVKSNQGYSDASSLIGVTVTLTYDQEVQSKVYEGEVLNWRVPNGKTYTLKFGEVDGYASPQQVTYQAKLGQIREIDATWETTVTTFIISSNQSGPDSNLVGKKVATISYGDKSIDLNYEGSSIDLKIPTGTAITVTPENIKGYGTQGQFTKLVQSLTDSVTISFNSTLFSVSISSNQGAESITNKVSLNAAYGSVNDTVNYTGSTLYINIPTGSEYTITPSELTGYRVTPANVSGTAVGTASEASFTYESELVTLNITSDNGGDISSSTLTITNTSDSSTIWSGPASTKAQINIAYGIEYKLSFTDLSGYRKPEDTTYTASQVSRSIDLQFIEIKAGKILINKTSSAPDAVSVEGQEVFDSLLSKFRRCLVSPSDDGGVDIAYLDDTNSNFYEDGQEAVLTGTEGDVMVYFPEMWYYGEEDDTNYIFNIAEEEIEGYHHAPASLVGVYHANQNVNELHSWSGVNPTAANRSSLSTAARIRTGFHLIDYQQHCIIAWMFLAKYKTRNSSAMCGNGPDQYSFGIANGSTNALGITDTTAGTTDTKVNFLGIEGCWGENIEMIEGIHSYSSDGIIAYDKGDYYDQPYDSVVSDTKRIIAASSSNSSASYGGWMADIYAGEYCDLVGKSSGGSDSTYYCDGFFCNLSNSNSLTFWRSIYPSTHDNNAGVFSLGNTIGSTYGAYTRLAYDGQINVLSPTSYKNTHGIPTDAFSIWIKDVSDPAGVVVSDDAKANSLLGKFHRYLATATDGVATICQLDDTDSTKYAMDGSDADLTGSEGDVMVYFPEFWYWGEDTIDGGHRLWISENQPGSKWKHAAPSLVGAYKANVSGNVLHSWSGGSIQQSTSISQFHTYAQNHGTGWHLIDYQQHCILTWMFMARYKTRDCLGSVGYGHVPSYDVSGSTNSLGMTDTTPETSPNNGSFPLNFLGVEGAYGVRYEYMEGIHSTSSKILIYDKGYHTGESSVTSDDLRTLSSPSPAYGFLKDILGGEYFDMIGVDLTGSRSTYYGSYQDIRSGSYVFRRSSVNSDTDGGLFFIYGADSGGGDSTMGTRLAFDGTIEIENDPDIYKSILGGGSADRFSYIIGTSSDPADITMSPRSEKYANELLSKFRRCLASKKADGEVDITYLDDSNSNLYEDGTSATLTGMDGDVMVYFPEFWYMGKDYEDGRHKFSFSETEVEGWHHAEASLVGAYKANVYNSNLPYKMGSWSGVTSALQYSPIEWNSLGQNTGQGYHMIDYQQHCIIAWMFMARYKNRNSQAICGTGPNDFRDIPNGSTNSLGITDTTPETASSSGSTLVNFLGIEGAWGYQYEYLQGLHHNSSDGIILYDKGYYTNDTRYDSVTSSTKRTILSGVQEIKGYVSDIIGGEYMDIIAKDNGTNGTESTYYCDYNYFNISGGEGSFRRTHSVASSEDGPFSMYYYSGSDVDETSRLSFDGTINELSNSNYRDLYANSARLITMDIKNEANPASITVTEPTLGRGGVQYKPLE